MERSRVPIRKWLLAIDIMARSGMTASRLSSEIGVTYKTAWLMMHKLREAMNGHHEDLKLNGLVRVETGMTGRQSIPSLLGLHPTEAPFIIGGTMEADGSVRQIAVQIDGGGDTYRRRITAQGARHFVDRYVDLRRSVVDLTTDEYGRTNVRPLHELAYRIEVETNRYSGWRKNLHHYVQEAVYRCNLRLTEAEPFQALLNHAVRYQAPTLSDVQARTASGRPDWRTERNANRLFAELKAYATGILAHAASSIEGNALAI